MIQRPRRRGILESGGCDKPVKIARILYFFSETSSTGPSGTVNIVGVGWKLIIMCIFGKAGTPYPLFRQAGKQSGYPYPLLRQAGMPKKNKLLISTSPHEFTVPEGPEHWNQAIIYHVLTRIDDSFDSKSVTEFLMITSYIIIPVSYTLHDWRT